MKSEFAFNNRYETGGKLKKPEIDKFEDEIVDQIENFEGKLRWKFKKERPDGLYFKPKGVISDLIKIKINYSDHILTVMGIIKTHREDGFLKGNLTEFVNNSEAMVNLAICAAIDKYNAKHTGSTSHQKESEKEELTKNKNIDIQLDSLKKLKDLYDAKILTKKEFEEKKKKILEKI